MKTPEKVALGFALLVVLNIETEFSKEQAGASHLSRFPLNNARQINNMYQQHVKRFLRILRCFSLSFPHGGDTHSGPLIRRASSPAPSQIACC